MAYAAAADLKGQDRETEVPCPSPETVGKARAVTVAQDIPNTGLQNDRDLTPPKRPTERRAVRLAARRLTDKAPALVAGSAGALRAGLAARAASLRRATLAAWPAGIPLQVIAADARLSPGTVRRWIAAESHGHS